MEWNIIIKILIFYPSLYLFLSNMFFLAFLLLDVFKKKSLLCCLISSSSMLHLFISNKVSSWILLYLCFFYFFYIYIALRVFFLFTCTLWLKKLILAFLLFDIPNIYSFILVRDKGYSKHILLPSFFLLA